MTVYVNVKPTKNRKVRHPVTDEPLPASGTLVPTGPELSRLLRDGDVEPATGNKAKSGKTKASK